MKPWQLFLVHASLVCSGLALETFYPAARVVLCNPAVTPAPLFPPVTEQELAARFNIAPQSGAILESFERNYGPYSSWGDYPSSDYSFMAIV